MESNTNRSTEQAVAFIMDRYKGYIAGKYDLSSQSKRELLEIEANFRICEKDLDYEKNHGLLSFRKTAGVLLGI